MGQKRIMEKRQFFENLKDSAKKAASKASELAKEGREKAIDVGSKAKQAGQSFAEVSKKRTKEFLEDAQIVEKLKETTQKAASKARDAAKASNLPKKPSKKGVILVASGLAAGVVVGDLVDTPLTTHCATYSLESEYYLMDCCKYNGYGVKSCAKKISEYLCKHPKFVGSDVESCPIDFR